VPNGLGVAVGAVSWALAGSALAHGLAVGRARLVRRKVKPAMTAPIATPKPKDIALSVPGHDVAEEHHRENRDDQTDELALQVTDVVNQQPAGQALRNAVGSPLPCQKFARNRLRAASRRLTMQPSTAVLTCAVV
jgi:hypothetical protein